MLGKFISSNELDDSKDRNNSDVQAVANQDSTKLDASILINQQNAGIVLPGSTAIATNIAVSKPTKELEQQPINKNIAKERDYALKLLDNFTLKNLQNLFERPKFLEKILAIDCMEQNFLCSVLASYEKSMQLSILLQRYPLYKATLTECIIANKELFAKADGSGTSVRNFLLYWFTENSNSSLIFNLLLKANARLANCFSGEMLARNIVVSVEFSSRNDEPYKFLHYHLGQELIFVPPSVKILAEATARDQILPFNYHFVRGEVFTVFYMLTGFSVGREILAMLLQQCPEFCGAITAANLARALPISTMFQGVKISSLFWLSSMEQERKILAFLLENNHRIALGITIDILVEEVNIFDGTSNQNSSLLRLLAETKDGCNILLQLFTLNKRLAQSITGQHLTCANHSAKVRDANLFIVYLLSRWLVGVQILQLIFNENPNIAKDITAEILTINSQIKGREFGISMLFNLSAYSEDGGIEILQKIFRSNSDISQKITAKILTAKLLGSAKEFANLTILYLLARSDAGCAILLELLHNNPNIATEININDLLVIPKQASYIKQLTILQLLIYCPEGRQVFKFLLEKNPELVKNISTELLTVVPQEINTEPTTELPKVSLLNYLLLTRDGLPILRLLLENNHSFTKGTFVEESMKVITGVTFIEYSKQIYYWLSEPDGQRCLQLLLNRKKEVINYLQGVNLSITPICDVRESIPVLYYLVNNETGQKLLQILLVRNKAISKSITIKELAFAPSSGDYANISVLDWLLNSKVGINILSTLFEQDLALASGVSFAHLTNTVFAAQSNAQDLSEPALYALTATDVGLSILSKIFVQNRAVSEAAANWYKQKFYACLRSEQEGDNCRKVKPAYKKEGIARSCHHDLMLSAINCYSGLMLVDNKSALSIVTDHELITKHPNLCAKLKLLQADKMAVELRIHHALEYYLLAIYIITTFTDKTNKIDKSTLGNCLEKLRKLIMDKSSRLYNFNNFWFHRNIEYVSQIVANKMPKEAIKLRGLANDVAKNNHHETIVVPDGKLSRGTHVETLIFTPRLGGFYSKRRSLSINHLPPPGALAAGAKLGGKSEKPIDAGVAALYCSGNLQLDYSNPRVR